MNREFRFREVARPNESASLCGYKSIMLCRGKFMLLWWHQNIAQFLILVGRTARLRLPTDKRDFTCAPASASVWSGLCVRLSTTPLWISEFSSGL